MAARFSQLGRLAIATILVANYAYSTGANGQNASQTGETRANQANPAAAACPTGAEITPQHLYGLWRAEFAGLAQGATLLFEKHPELAGSVRGAVNRDGAKSLLAGDVDDGVFTIEESDNGQAISATWSGVVAEGSCGKEISGTWIRASDASTRRFVLRKLPGWQ